LLKIEQDRIGNRKSTGAGKRENQRRNGKENTKQRAQLSRK